MKSALLAVVGVAGVAAASPAAAVTFYDLNYSTSDATVVAKLTIDDRDPSRLLVTGITGTRNGEAITQLVQAKGFAGNDNIVFNNDPYFTYFGTAFKVGSAFYNVYNGFDYNGGISQLLECRASNCNPTFASPKIVSFSFKASAGAVPEPATWAMMLIGFGMIGATARYRRRSSTATYA